MYKEVKKAKATLKGSLEKVVPTGNGVMIAIKSWPAQSKGGVLVPDQYRVVRDEKYITEVLAVGEHVSIVKEGDIVVCSMYSGHHIANDEKQHAKIIAETDILAHKEKRGIMMYKAETFTPGIDYVLVKLETPKEIITAAGLVVPAHVIQGDNQKQDVATLSGEIVAMGPKGEDRKPFSNVKVGAKVIFDSYVGLDLPNIEVDDDVKYRIMYVWGVLAVIG